MDYEQKFRDETMVRDKLDHLIAVGLYTLGYMMAKHGERDQMVRILARGLKQAGAECDYVDAIVQGEKDERNRLATAKAVSGIERAFGGGISTSSECRIDPTGPQADRST